MNEDSGGRAGGAAFSLSAAEEAALLAEYGTETPSAVGLDWAAPSRFKSQIGDGDIFLTGAGGDGKGDEHSDADENTAASSLLTSRKNRVKHDHSDPLALYLLRYAPSLILLTKSTPASLALPISNVVRTVEDAESSQGQRRASSALAYGARQEAASRFSPVLRTAREWERRASLAARGIPTTAFASYLLSTDNDSAQRDCTLGEASAVGGGNDSGAAAARDADLDNLVGISKDLLRDAEDLLAHLAKPAAAAERDSEVQQAVAEMERREALLTEDVVDQHWAREEVLNADDDDAATHELLVQARERRKRLCAELAATQAVSNTRDGGTHLHLVEKKIEVEQHEGRQSTCTEAVAPLSDVSSRPPQLNFLYAFEMELPRSLTLAAEEAEESGHQHGDEDVHVTQEYLAGPSAELTFAEEPLSIPQLLLRSSEVLRAIHAAESRDAHVVPCVADEQPRLEAAITSKRKRDALGLVSLPTFVERLDTLLSPFNEEWQERERCRTQAALQHSEETASPSRNPQTSSGKPADAYCQRDQKESTHVLPTRASPAVPSLEAIRRTAAIESFLLQREAEEGRAMRREEELLERERLAAEDLAMFFAESFAALHDEALTVRARIAAEEAAAMKEMTAAQAKDATLARQAEQLRRLQEVEALSYMVMMSWEVHREQLIQEEALVFRQIVRDAAEDEASAIAAMKKREKSEADAERALLEALRRAFEESRVVLQESGACREKKVPYDGLRDSAWYHRCIVPLLAEQHHLTRWAIAQRKPAEQLRALLVEAEGRYRRHTLATVSPKDAPESVGRLVRVPPAPPAKDTSKPATASIKPGAATTLDAEKLLHVLWPAFQAAVRQPRQAAQYLARWCLSLEDISAVDWLGLQSLRLMEESAKEAAPLVVMATHYVKDLDMSSNVLAGVDVLQVVRSFPVLQRLTLSHAHLTRLDDAASSTTAARNSLSQRGEEAPLRSARASLSADDDRPSSSKSSSSHLRHISAARNHAIAEQVHLLEIDVSSNTLTSLSPLGAMATASLTRCTAVDNRLASLDSLVACAQLRGVSAARNRLTSLEGLESLGLLRELDVGNNNLCHFVHGEVAKVGSESGANRLMVLTKLFLSHNRLTRLSPSTASPSLCCVYPCLTQLFVNHNELTSLDAEAMAWLPLLRVLQAEGNKLVDISGLARCTRLESARLSHNRLATLEALLPLTSCRRLRVLDLSGNPVFPGVEAGGDQNGVLGVLRTALPWLEELNNTKLRPTSTHALPAQDTPFLAAKDKRSVGERCSFFRPASTSLDSLSELYAAVFSALCWDGMLQHVQDEHELQEALLSRELNRARGWEATLTLDPSLKASPGIPQAADDGGGAAVATLYGFTAAQRDTRRAEQEREIGLFQLDRSTLGTWLHIADRGAAETPASAGHPVVCANRHEVHSAYRQKEVDHMTRLARSYIAEWLFARVLVRRARRTLQELRRVHQQSESFRRETAARRIQPLWRGAALRSRLKRLLHGANADDDDDNAFAKVNVNEWLLEDPTALAPVELLLHTVVGSASGVATVPFDVPATLLSLASLSGGGGGARKEEAAPQLTFTPAPPSGAPKRSQSGASPTGRPSPQQHTQPPRAESASLTATPASANDTTSLEAQWGPTVAAQIRKKQQKNSRANQERMRKEFIHDPLRVQQEMRGAPTTRNAK